MNAYSSWWEEKQSAFIIYIIYFLIIESSLHADYKEHVFLEYFIK